MMMMMMMMMLQKRRMSFSPNIPFFFQKTKTKLLAPDALTIGY